MTEMTYPFKLRRRSSSITADEILAWCDKQIEKELPYAPMMNVRAAKLLIATAMKDICR